MNKLHISEPHFKWKKLFSLKLTFIVVNLKISVMLLHQTIPHKIYKLTEIICFEQLILQVIFSFSMNIWTLPIINYKELISIAH